MKFLDRLVNGYYRVLLFFYGKSDDENFGPKEHSVLLAWLFQGMILHFIVSIFKEYTPYYQKIFYVIITFALVFNLVSYLYKNRINKINTKYVKSVDTLFNIVFCIIFSSISIYLFFGI